MKSFFCVNAVCMGERVFSRGVTFVIKTLFVVICCAHIIRPDKRHPIIRKLL